jgi:hypothetical protein
VSGACGLFIVHGTGDGCWKDRRKRTAPTGKRDAQGEEDEEACTVETSCSRFQTDISLVGVNAEFLPSDCKRIDD